MFDREHFHTIVLGGGPAGAQCALWLKNLGVPALLFEQEPSLGGQQRTVPDPLSNHYVVSSAGMRAQEIAGAIQENLSRHGVPFVCGAKAEVVGDDGEWFHVIGKTAHGTHHAYAKYLVLATGVEPKKAKFEPSETVFIGSADPRIRSGDFFRGKHVAVLGGGDNAMECYAFLAPQQPAGLMVFARTLRAGPKLLSEVPRDHINEGGYDCFVSRDPSRGSHVITIQDDPFVRFWFDYIIVNYGVESRKVLPVGMDPERNARGFLTVNEDCVTSNPRVLAIGEATQRMHPCVATSMADGVVAAKALERLFIQGAGTPASPVST